MGEIPAPVRTFADRVSRAYRIDRIILFGSRARGDHLRSSDYDLIVVSPDFDGVPFTDRISPLYVYWDAPEACEVLCYTPGEFAKKAGEIGTVAEALRHGVEVHESGSASRLDASGMQDRGRKGRSHRSRGLTAATAWAPPGS